MLVKLRHLAKSAIYKNNIIYILLVSEKRKLLRSYSVFVLKDEKVNAFP